MDAIILKAYFLNKLTYWLFPIIIIGLVVIYLKLNLTDEDRTMVCGAFIAIGFLIVFYLSRFEPKLIKFDEKNVEISYLAQPPFGKKSGIYAKNELRIFKKNDLLVLSTKVGIIAKIRRKALDAKDWEAVLRYFG